MRDLCIKCGHIDTERDTNNIHCENCHNADLYPLYDNVIEYITTLRARIARLEAAGNRMAENWVANFDGDLYCVQCKESVKERGITMDYSDYECIHAPDCPVTKWQEVTNE